MEECLLLELTRNPQSVDDLCTFTSRKHPSSDHEQGTALSGVRVMVKHNKEDNIKTFL